MSSRPLKSIGAGKLQEFTLSEEDYLAYQSGLHLAAMDEDDCSALTTQDQGGELVGTFTNTFFDETSNSDPLTLSTTATVTIDGDASSGVHTNTISGGGLPETAYIGDILEINIDGTASITNGNGYETISYSVATSGTAEFTEDAQGTPAPNVLSGTDFTWQDFQSPTLQGSYNATIRYTLTSVGSLNITINSQSIDQNNPTNTAQASLVLNTIEVQNTRPPSAVEDETDLFQNTELTAPIQNSGPLKKNPIFWQKTGTAGIKEMSDTELDILCERLVRNIINNELPGVFRLSDGQPDSTYAKFLPNVFTDTREDGTQNNYHIWMKQSGTLPTKVNPLSIFRQNSLFAGLRQLTDEEMRFTFGERVKKVIMDTGIGTYQLRSSVQGAPTDLGTWQARGTALDTRETFFDDPGYTGAADYEVPYSGQYIPNFE